MTAEQQTSAELQREIEADRRKIEEKLHAIQERMSPGELMDEFLAYARRSGGVEFFNNLGAAMKANPIPVALTGVGLAWLLADPGSRKPQTFDREDEQDGYPIATVKGSIRRVGPIEASFGERYSHFSDESGSRFRALTDPVGGRAGHFVDPGGRAYRGFADEAGKQITDIRDETGALFDEASGWASSAWRQASGVASSVSEAFSQSTGVIADTARDTNRHLQDQGTRLQAAIVHNFRDQPLVGAALAFAVGAAIGAALPSTDAEDATMGEASQHLRNNLADTLDVAATEAIETVRRELDDAPASDARSPDGNRPPSQSPVENG